MRGINLEEFRIEGGLSLINNEKPDDYFIVCASYEPISLSAINSLAPEYRARRGIIYVNNEFLNGRGSELTKSNLKRITEKLNYHCEEVITINGSWLNAKDQFIALRDGLSREKLDKSLETRITLDITTFNREALLSTVVLLRTYFLAAILRTVYVSAGDHGEWLSQGFRLVRNIIGFPGVQQPSRSTVLVVLSGFEPDRIYKTIEEHEPTKVLLGIGIPPTEQKFLERNIEEQNLILARQEVEKFCFPASNILGCREALESCIKPYLNNYNVIVAPMSTKLSTIATFLVAEQYPEIQITYCLPGEYNLSDYSVGEGEIFIDMIPSNS
jgi:hypothetical protein